MNILSFSNTFTPHVGGVARSVASFTDHYRNLAHNVLVVAPVFEGMPKKEQGVVRFPAIQNFNGSDFSVRHPIPAFLFPELEKFRADIIHTHHPFLLGDTALRIAVSRHTPLVFTHHTRYEEYTHYVPGDSPAMKRFAIELSTGYANLCDAVVAPSESIAALLRERGVTIPITVIPTGVALEQFSNGDGPRLRAKLSISEEAFIVGHVGRLAEEKNLGFLCDAVIRFLKLETSAHFLVAGVGPFEEEIRHRFSNEGLIKRFHHVGVLSTSELADVYDALDLFVFASQSETQGMVLTEAMAAGTPVLAVDAPGVREVLEDGVNGRLLPKEDLASFAEAMSSITALPIEERKDLQKGAKKTAEAFSQTRSVDRALKLYRSLIEKGRLPREIEDSRWLSLLPLIEAEWEIWSNLAHAAQAALIGHEGETS